MPEESQKLAKISYTLVIGKNGFIEKTKPRFWIRFLRRKICFNEKNVS